MVTLFRDTGSLLDAAATVKGVAGVEESEALESSSVEVESGRKG